MKKTPISLEKYSLFRLKIHFSIDIELESCKYIIICYIYIKTITEEKGSIMEITDIRIRKVDADSKMKAVVSVTFDDEFVVHDIKIIEGQNGLFIAMPSRKMGEGDFRDIAHPLKSETRNRIRDAILAEYEKLPEDATSNYSE